MKISKAPKIAVEVALGLALVALLVYAFWPKPLVVESDVITKGPLVVTVDGDGRTRIKDRFVVSAPVGGQMERITLRPGDKIQLGSRITLVTPIEPPLLDARSKAQAEAQVKLARATESQASSRVRTAEAALQHAKAELDRMRQLEKLGGSTKSALEDAELAARTASAELDSAKFGVGVARSQVEVSAAALLRATGKEGENQATVEVKSPVDGAVLRVLTESAGVVMAGAPLVEIGDPAGLEVVLDLLSSDAVLVKPGAETWLEHWGGESRLMGRVRLVEPSGFTKVSALGVEEQRVNVVVDFSTDAADRASLGDGYRVHARIVVWQKPDVIRVPLSALFRDGDAWAVFLVAGERAQKRTVEIGHRAERYAEVLTGLAEADRVIVHPGDRLTDGGRVVVSQR